MLKGVRWGCVRGGISSIVFKAGSWGRGYINKYMTAHTTTHNNFHYIISYRGKWAGWQAKQNKLKNSTLYFSNQKMGTKQAIVGCALKGKTTTL